jgi:hypothetical protein
MAEIIQGLVPTRTTKMRNRPVRRPTERQSPTSRTGLVLLETVIAATIVLAMLSIAAPLVIRSARIWKQTRHVQFAADELSAQMDRLIAMPADDRIQALSRLSVSPASREVLHEATLEGLLMDDENGKRIRLSIDWQRGGDRMPITLLAWIHPFATSLTDSVSANRDAGAENNQ